MIEVNFQSHFKAWDCDDDDDDVYQDTYIEL